MIFKTVSYFDTILAHYKLKGERTRMRYISDIAIGEDYELI